MKRTQIYLEENLYRDLKVCSQMFGISVSEYIRRLLAKEVYLDKMTKSPTSKKTLLKIAKKAVSFGRKDPAKNFDFYLEKSLK